MNNKAIELHILKTELNSLVRKGISLTPREQIPILYHLAYPKLRLSTESFKVFISRYIEEAFTNGKDASALLMLLSVSLNAGATTREFEASETLSLSVDAFRKTKRKKLFQQLAEYLQSEMDTFIDDKQNQFKDTSFSKDVIDILEKSTTGARDYLAQNPERLCLNYGYEAEIDFSFDLPKVTTDYKRDRILDDRSFYSVFICRTYEAMHISMQDSNIIGLEMAELNSAEWQARRDVFDCQLVCDNAQFEPMHIKKGKDFVRFDFDLSEINADQRQTIEIFCSYYIGQHINRFPVKLVNHFTLGSISIEFTLRGILLSSFDYGDYFAGFDGAQPFNQRAIRSRSIPIGNNKHRASIKLEPDTLVWPGSGIEFFWTKQSMKP